MEEVNKIKNEEMEKAIENLNYTKIRDLVTSGYDVTRQNSNILKKVIFKGRGTENQKIFILRYLLRNGAKINAGDVLLTAVNQNSCQIASFLIDEGADITRDDYAAIYAASKIGNKCYLTFIEEYPEIVKIYNDHFHLNYFHDSYVIRESPMEFSVAAIEDDGSKHVMIGMYSLNRNLVQLYEFLPNPENLAEVLGVYHPEKLPLYSPNIFDPAQSDYAVYFTCIEQNYTQSLEVLLDYYSDQELLNRLFSYACYFNNTEIIDFLIVRGAEVTQEALENAVRGNHPYLAENILKSKNLSLVVARKIAKGNKAMLKVLADRRSRLSSRWNNFP